MSDSDESFESADEGENGEAPKQKKKSSKEAGAEIVKEENVSQLSQEEVTPKSQSNNDSETGSKVASPKEDSDSVEEQSLEPGIVEEEKKSSGNEPIDTGEKDNQPEHAGTEKVDNSQNKNESSQKNESFQKNEPATLPTKQEDLKPVEQPSAALDKLSESSSKKSGWGWGGWGSSLLETATSSVTTFTSSVGEGFSNVLETVESTLGAPDPEELAKSECKEEDCTENTSSGEDTKATTDSEKDKPVDPKEIPDGQDISRGSDGSDPKVVIVEDNSEKDAGWFSTLGVSALTGAVSRTVQHTSSIVQEKSKGLVHGGLDVLETIGKKTYDVLAEGDHGLKKTIGKAKEKPSLSKLLREAAEEADEAAKQEEEFIESRKSHFGAQFDDFQGLVQLEALEMLSNQCETKVNSLMSTMTSEQVSSVQAELDSVKQSFHLGDLDDDDEKEEHAFTDLVTEFTGKLALNLTAAKLIQVHEKVRNCISEYDKKSEEKSEEGSEVSQDNKLQDIHQMSIQSIAELTARTVEHFHRIGQLSLIDPKGPVSGYKDKANAIASLTKCACSEVGIMSTKFTNCLTMVAEKCDDPESANPLITNVFLEADNSSTYMQNAFQLLLPVLHQATIQATET